MNFPINLNQHDLIAEEEPSLYDFQHSEIQQFTDYVASGRAEPRTESEQFNLTHANYRSIEAMIANVEDLNFRLSLMDADLQSYKRRLDIVISDLEAYQKEGK